MDKVQKFGRNSKRFFKRLVNREEEKEENLSFTTHIHEERQVITWRIENFDRCPLQPGEYHQSPQFCTGFSSNTKWALRIYPRGKTKLGKFGIFICKMSSHTKVAVEFSLHIEVPDVDREIPVLEQNKFRMDSEEYGSDVNLPCSNFMRQKWLKIFCVLSVGYIDEADDGNCTAESSSLCPLSADLKEIYSSGKFSDITLQVGKKQFPAHKAILSARSNVFAAMFEHPMEESHTNFVNIEDIEPSVLSDLLYYIYTGAIESLTVGKAASLFAVADKYSLADLQKRCVSVMLAKLCVENACQIATLADMHSEMKLKTAANHVFRKHKHQIFERKEWKTLIEKRPLLASEILQNVSTDFNTACSDVCPPSS